MSTEWSDAEIAAWVDGTLEGHDAERIERIMAQDPKARAYAEKVWESNEQLRAAFGAPIDEPVPASIKGAILGAPGQVTALPRRRWQAEWRPMALAASLALVIGAGAGGFLWTPEGSRMIAVLGDAPLEGPLHEALEGLPSGTLSTAGVRPMLTFRDQDGRACREFEVVGELPDDLEFGIACRQAPTGTWYVEMVVAAEVPENLPDTGFAPASGAAGDALDAMLDALGAGPAIGPDEEARLLGAGWSETP